jgi:hypothetical protein
LATPQGRTARKADGRLGRKNDKTVSRYLIPWTNIALGTCSNSSAWRSSKQAGDPNVGEFSDVVVLKKFDGVPEELSVVIKVFWSPPPSDMSSRPSPQLPVSLQQHALLRREGLLAGALPPPRTKRLKYLLLLTFLLCEFFRYSGILRQSSKEDLHAETNSSGVRSDDRARISFAHFGGTAVSAANRIHAEGARRTMRDTRPVREKPCMSLFGLLKASLGQWSGAGLTKPMVKNVTLRSARSRSPANQATDATFGTCPARFATSLS